jgi:shikimate dehydrogenase
VKLLLLGDPVEHSRSPAIHTAALAAAGIEGTYEARRVDRAGMASAVDEIRYGGLDGASVTMPHKEAAFALADRVSEGALRAGAVNTLIHREGMAEGENTDITGLIRVWGEAGLSTTAPVLILGSGGAAAGAMVALAEHQIAVSARSPERAAELLARTRTHGEVVEWGSAVQGAIVVNTTPLGMEGEPLPDGVVERADGLVDLPYGSERTPAVVTTLALGLPCVDGREVLLAQAAAAFELWTGMPAPLGAMRAAL